MVQVQGIWGFPQTRGYLILRVLIIGILLFRGTIFLSPIFGNSHTGTWTNTVLKASTPLSFPGLLVETMLVA